jgi:hypothetical protein
MSDDPLHITPADLEELGERLDAAALTEKDKRILMAAFSLAGEMVTRGEAEDVSGFQLRSPAVFSTASVRSTSLHQGLSSGFQQSLTTGAVDSFQGAGISIMISFMPM